MDPQPNNMPPAPEPMPQSNTNVMPARKPKAWMIVAILAILVLIGASVFGYFKWKQYRELTGQLGAQISALQNQVKELEAQVASMQKPATTSSQAVSTQGWKTYSGKNGITFLYPSNYYVDDTTDPNTIFVSSFKIGTNGTSIPSSEVKIDILVSGKSFTTTINPSNSQQLSTAQQVIKTIKFQ